MLRCVLLAQPPKPPAFDTECCLADNRVVTGVCLQLRRYRACLEIFALKPTQQPKDFGDLITFLAQVRRPAAFVLAVSKSVSSSPTYAATECCCP